MTINRDGSNFGNKFVTKTCIKDIGLVLGLDFGTELVASRECEGSLMVVDADDGCEAPALLVDVKQHTSKLTIFSTFVSNHMTTEVTVVVVGTETCRCREAVENLVGEVDLSAIDILFAGKDL